MYVHMYVHLQVLGRQQKLQPARFCMYNTHTHTLGQIFIYLFIHIQREERVLYASVCIQIYIGWLW